MNKKKYIIIIFLLLLFNFICNENNKITINNFMQTSFSAEIPLSEEKYVFITKWGSEGSKDGQFGTALLDWYIITDKTIAKLKNKLSDDKLKKLKDIKDIEFSINEISTLLKKSDFDNVKNEITMILENSEVITKLSDVTLNNRVLLGVSNNVYVGDNNNHRVQKFDSNGNFITKWNFFLVHRQLIIDG